MHVSRNTIVHIFIIQYQLEPTDQVINNNLTK